nr:MAG TPA: hypothetical protein [Caudoviricetes sp.]
MTIGQTMFCANSSMVERCLPKTKTVVRFHLCAQ